LLVEVENVFLFGTHTVRKVGNRLTWKWDSFVSRNVEFVETKYPFAGGSPTTTNPCTMKQLLTLLNKVLRHRTISQMMNQQTYLKTIMNQI